MRWRLARVLPFIHMFLPILFDYQSLNQMRSSPVQRICLLLALLFSLTSPHMLLSFHPEIAQLQRTFSSGDTSHAFSISMKLYMKTNALYESSGMTPPNPADEGLQIPCCRTLLNQTVDLFSSDSWIQQYQNIFNKLKQLHLRCTNSDFSYGSHQKQLEGFDDKCALCTILSKVMENYILFHKRNVTDFIENEFCSLFDGILKPTCQAFTHYFGPTFIKAFLRKQNSDVICHSAGLCRNKQCRINSPFHQSQFDLVDADSIESKPAPWEWLVHLFTDRFADKHLPPFDFDNDSFSDISTFRGHHWRGADCNQISADVYPGRKQSSHKLADQDCNGIFGFNPKGKSYEQLFCSSSKRLGVAVIGDSAGAHFSIPQKFFNVTMMGKGSFHDLLPRIADELDLPHESAYTGHTNTSYLSHSVYKYLREWNLCNHNDFQNLGVNGGDSGNTWGNIKALKRNQTHDYPLLIFLELIGNDVCSKDFNGMTKPEQFKKNILKLLHWLDETVPAGSHLMILGLAEGDLLFEYLHGTMHPLNVTYDKVYDFLNCLKISPCWGWLNSNETIRKMTTAHAKLLSKVYQEIIQESFNFKNFDIAYYDFPTDDIIKRKILEGGDPRDMIEKCDGFHPSGEFNSFLADWMWSKIQEFHPTWVGEKNPHNEDIRKIFGLHSFEDHY